MNYLNTVNTTISRITKASKNFYSQVWPDFTNSSNLFSMKVISNANNQFSVLLIVHRTLKAYLLHENVYNYEGTSTEPPGLKFTFFGLNQCNSGWLLPACELKTCPNSLSLNSMDGLVGLQFECSGHGTCNNGTCICDSLWEGSDCSTYKRASCNGSSLSNFPMRNCECMDATLGGNSCTVKFCPSGCTVHGSCSNGICACSSGYHGADCSIMIVRFKV